MECRTLKSVVEELGIRHVDFMSLDIEGMEAEALRGAQLSRYLDIDMIMIEGIRHEKSSESVNESYKLLEDNDFKMMTGIGIYRRGYPIDSLFLKKNSLWDQRCKWKPPEEPLLISKVPRCN